MFERISIEIITPDMYPLAAAWLSEPDINRWLYAEWRDNVITERVIAFAAHSPKNRIWLYRVDDKPYGLGSVGNIVLSDRSGVIWYLRGSGVARVPGAMTIAVGAMIQEAIKAFNLHSLSASIQDGNIGSSLVLLANRFQRVGAMRQAFQTQNGYVDRVIFDLLAADVKSVPSEIRK